MLDMYIFEFFRSLEFISCHVYSKNNGMLMKLRHMKMERKVFWKKGGVMQLPEAHLEPSKYLPI